METIFYWDDGEIEPSAVTEDNNNGAEKGYKERVKKGGVE